MEIKVLGTGCPKCKKLAENTQEALNELGQTTEIIKEEDIMNIMAYGILRTPGLVIDGKVVMSGRLPSVSEIKDLIIQNS